MAVLLCLASCSGLAALLACSSSMVAWLSAFSRVVLVDGGLDESSLCCAIDAGLEEPSPRRARSSSSSFSGDSGPSL
jgi:hypothetical protein